MEGNVPPKQTRRIRLRTLQSECFDTACLPFRRPALLTWQPFREHQGLEGRSRFRSRATLASAQSLAEMRDFQELRHFSAQKGDYRRRWNHGRKLHILTPLFWALGTAIGGISEGASSAANVDDLVVFWSRPLCWCSSNDTDNVKRAGQSCSMSQPHSYLRDKGC